MSGIVLWEIAKLTKLGRIELDLQRPQVKKVRSSIHVWPITLEIARTADNLDVPLVTRDRKLRASSLIPLA